MLESMGHKFSFNTTKLHRTGHNDLHYFCVRLSYLRRLIALHCCVDLDQIEQEPNGIKHLLHALTRAHIFSDNPSSDGCMKTNQNDILEELILSQQSRTVVGIKIKQSAKLIVTEVVEIDDQQEIHLNPFNVYGRKIEDTKIRLLQIESVIRFNSHYEDPIYVRLRQIRESINRMRS